MVKPAVKAKQNAVQLREDIASAPNLICKGANEFESFKQAQHMRSAASQNVDTVSLERIRQFK